MFGHLGCFRLRGESAGVVEQIGEALAGLTGETASDLKVMQIRTQNFSKRDGQKKKKILV